MKYDEFARRLAPAKIEPVYVIYGREDLLVSFALALIKKKLLGEEQGRANYTETNGDDADPAALFDLLRTRDLFGTGGRHLVVMYNAGRFATTHRRLIADFHRSGAAAGSLALLVPGPEQGGYRIPAHLGQIGLLVDCQSPRAGEAIALLRKIASGLGKRLSPAAARFLVDTGGHNLGQLRQHIHALADLIGDRQEITESDILQLVGGDFQREVWDLLNALGAGKPGEALLVIDRLFRQAKPEAVAPNVIGALNYEFRQLAQAKELLDAGEPPSRVRGAMTGPRAVRDQRLRAANRLTWGQLAQRTALLAEADIRCKTSALPPQTALETLLLRLCRLTETGAGV